MENVGAICARRYQQSANISLRCLIFTLSGSKSSLFTSTVQWTGLNVILPLIFPPAYCFISSRGKRRTYRIRSSFRKSLRKQARASQQGHKSSLIQISPSKSNKTVCHAPTRSPISPLYGSGRWHWEDGPKKSNILNRKQNDSLLFARYTYSHIKLNLHQFTFESGYALLDYVSVN